MIKAVIFDLDGTLFLGKTAIPGAAKKLEELRSNGIKTIFLTNAATRSRENLLEKIISMGLSAQKDEVYCSSYFLAKYISELHKGKTVYVVGEQGINDELEEHGIKVVDENADIVTVGLDRYFTYEKLAKALKQLQNGAILLSSNKDTTYPTENGFMPGAGSIVVAVEAASGKEAISLGKPNTYALEQIKLDHGFESDEIIMVGDRLDTDITFAKKCGIKSVLLLTGVSKKEDIKEIKPDYIFDSITEFNLP